MQKVDEWDNKVPPDDVVMFLINKAYEAGEKRHKDDPVSLKFLNDQKSKDAYFLAALEIANEFILRRSTIEKIINDYLKRLERSHSYFTDFRLPLKQVMVGFVSLGVSTTVVEKLLKCFAEKGTIWAVIEMVKILKRQLTKDEILSLVKYYNGGAVQSDETENDLIKLAKFNLSEADALEIKKMIDARRVEFRSSAD